MSRLVHLNLDETRSMQFRVEGMSRSILACIAAQEPVSPGRLLARFRLSPARLRVVLDEALACRLIRPTLDGRCLRIAWRGLEVLARRPAQIRCSRVGKTTAQRRHLA